MGALLAWRSRGPAFSAVRGGLVSDSDEWFGAEPLTRLAWFGLTDDGPWAASDGRRRGRRSRCR